MLRRKAEQNKNFKENTEMNKWKDGSPFSLCSRSVTYPGETVEQRIIDVPSGRAVARAKQVEIIWKKKIERSYQKESTPTKVIKKLKKLECQLLPDSAPASPYRTLSACPSVATIIKSTSTSVNKSVYV